MAVAPLFVSHGAPNMILFDTPARRFLAGLASIEPRPKGIVVVSAHFETGRPTVVADPAPGMIYDFGGFESELYTMVYPAPGDPVLALKVAGLLDAAGFAPAMAPKRGYDHGAWVPLTLIAPEADVPVVQVSVQPGRSPEHHMKLGAALASLADEDILVLASGSLTHNLRAVFGPRGIVARDAAVDPRVTEFAEWIATGTADGDVEALTDFARRAPHAHWNHPTDEHFLPFFVALGAGGGKGRRVHASVQHAAIAMDVYRFGAAA